MYSDTRTIGIISTTFGGSVYSIPLVSLSSESEKKSHVEKKLRAERYQRPLLCINSNSVRLPVLKAFNKAFSHEPMPAHRDRKGLWVQPSVLMTSDAAQAS